MEKNKRSSAAAVGDPSVPLAAGGGASVRRGVGLCRAGGARNKEATSVQTLSTTLRSASARLPPNHSSDTVTLASRECSKVNGSRHGFDGPGEAEDERGWSGHGSAD